MSINTESNRVSNNLFPYSYTQVRNPYNPVEQLVTYERLSWIYTFFFMVNIANMILSIIDLLFSLSEFDCKNTINPIFTSITLGKWLITSSIFGLFYSIFSMMSIFYLIQFYEYNEPNFHRKCQTTLKILYITCILFLMIWNVFGFFIFYGFYSSVCTSSVILTYMWIRLFLGSSINTIFFFTSLISNFFINDNSIRSYFYQINQIRT